MENAEQTLILPAPDQLDTKAEPSAQAEESSADRVEIEQYMSRLLERMGASVAAGQDESGPPADATGSPSRDSGPPAHQSAPQPVSQPAPPPSPAVDGDGPADGVAPAPRGGKGPTQEEILGMRAVANQHAHRTLSTHGLIRQAYNKLFLAGLAIVVAFVLLEFAVLFGAAQPLAICVALLVAVHYSAQYLIQAGRLAQVPQEEEAE